MYLWCPITPCTTIPSVKKAYTLVIFLIYLFCLSCQKKAKPNIDPIVPVEVYVTFSNTFGASGQYWKNGEMVNLATSNSYANTRGIFVNDNNVHVVGDASLSSNVKFSPFVGQYWINGIVSNIESVISSNLLFDLVVSDGNVYICGDGLNTAQLKTQAAYWKNGVAVPLDEANIRDSRARGIFVTGKDVYVAGSLNYQNETAVYWKNGRAVALGDPLSVSHANSVAVYGTDVHIAGSEGTRIYARARYWKNGAGTFLTDGSEFFSEAVDIAVSGKDVYCVGNLQYHDSTRAAVLWKNGIPQSLPGAIRVSSVYVFKNDVYVAGEGIDNAIKSPMYWKNGVQVVLPNNGNGSFASSIFVKQSNS
jgi:hypothetical protein